MAMIYGCWFEDLDPDKRMVEEADDLRDAQAWAQSQDATVVTSADGGKTWTVVR